MWYLVTFFPAAIVVTLWCYAIFSDPALFGKTVGEYYPMSLAMIPGSFFAGSTPLGGGSTAYPVGVLVLGFDAIEGRDFAAMIQSVGMGAATYLIMLRRRHLLRQDILLINAIIGTIALTVTFNLDIDSFALNVAFTTNLLCFSVIFLYFSEILPWLEWRAVRRLDMSHVSVTVAPEVRPGDSYQLSPPEMNSGEKTLNETANVPHESSSSQVTFAQRGEKPESEPRSEPRTLLSNKVGVLTLDLDLSSPLEDGHVSVHSYHSPQQEQLSESRKFLKILSRSELKYY